jgi:hypothetical protein
MNNLSWEDVLKRGKVPKKPTRKDVDTGFKSKYKPSDKKPISDEQERKNRDEISRRFLADRRDFAIYQKERLKRQGLPPEAIHWSDEQWEKHRDKRSQEREEARKESQKVKQQKRAGTYRPKKGQKKRNKQTPKSETRMQRKNRIEAQKDRKAKKERYAREDAARAERDRRRGL